MRIVPTYIDETRKTLNPKLKVRYDPELGTISTDDGFLTFSLPSIKREELAKLRHKRPNKFLILKKDDVFFTSPKAIEDNIDDIVVKDSPHLCPECKNFFKCQKVIDYDVNYFYNISKGKYIGSKRIEKYDFITLGCHMPNHFVVWKCNDFVNPEFNKYMALQEEEDEEEDECPVEVW